jgi:hypothetical protein
MWVLEDNLCFTLFARAKLQTDHLASAETITNTHFDSFLMPLVSCFSWWQENTFWSPHFFKYLFIWKSSYLRRRLKKVYWMIQPFGELRNLFVVADSPFTPLHDIAIPIWPHVPHVPIFHFPIGYKLNTLHKCLSKKCNDPIHTRKWTNPLQPIW